MQMSVKKAWNFWVEDNEEKGRPMLSLKEATEECCKGGVNFEETNDRGK